MTTQLLEEVTIGEPIQGTCTCPPAVREQGMIIDNFHTQCKGYIPKEAANAPPPKKERLLAS